MVGLPQALPNGAAARPLRAWETLHTASASSRGGGGWLRLVAGEEAFYTAADVRGDPRGQGFCGESWYVEYDLHFDLSVHQLEEAWVDAGGCVSPTAMLVHYEGDIARGEA